ncbi:choice-of-anchor H family protein [Shewanella sp. AS1]|uniref:choice-of-anchor H family protein n=1 Tax=Shewanella sp. AS1 TaxID=2907626 RepID=UPI001F210291|nr:choice-of-anchor H family protein [Shewanella sp. AS1]MCE9678132.1 choice-of-anchor H family protein [Shewanella sp. AS1]
MMMTKLKSLEVSTAVCAIKARMARVRVTALILSSLSLVGGIQVSNAQSINIDAQSMITDAESRVSSVSIKVKQDEQTRSQVFSRAAQQMTANQQAGAEQLTQLAPSQTVRKTREQVIAERQSTGYSSESVEGEKNAPLKSAAQRLNSGIYRQFAIYEASSRLFTDYDYDGFYQTFSVTFDADVYGYYSGEYAQVFADLYLSRNGGPWELYHTTDVFTIVDNASDDDFEVLTTLYSGYPSDHYDLLIDLYEVGYWDIVATISSDDVEDLYALPLESSDRDEYYIDGVTTEVVIRGGSVSFFGLGLLLAVIGFRRIS